MAEAVDWQEKYVTYLEGDLQKDIRKVEDGQKALDAKIDRVEEGLRKDIKVLDGKIDRVEEGLRKDIKDLGGKVDRILYIIAGAAVAALIGGIIGGILRMFAK